MLSSVVDYFSNKNDQQGSQINSSQKQNQAATGNSLIEDYGSPFSCGYVSNQSHPAVVQSQFMNINNSQQNLNANLSQQNSIVGQQQLQQQFLQNTPSTGIVQPQSVSNQSILSIKTQANREQQYVYCPTHTEYFITNICAQKECIEPLCPECIVGHNELHVHNKTQSQLQNIQSAREVSLNHTENIIKQLTSEKQIIVPQLQKAMNDNFKRNIETLNSLKSQILQIVESYFKDVQNKLNETYMTSKDLIEQLNAVMYQRVDFHQNIYKELQSPLYIKSLIESMENPTSFQIEESSYQYMVDMIKENNALSFSKSQQTEEILRSVIPQFYSYQKKQRIFQSPGRGLIDSRRMSDSINNSGHNDQLKGLTSPLSQKSNIFNQQPHKTSQSIIKDLNSPNLRQSIVLNSRSSIPMLSPPQKDGLQNLKQNLATKSMSNIKITNEPYITGQKDIGSSQQIRSKTNSIGNENYYAQTARDQTLRSPQLVLQQNIKLNSFNKNNGTTDDQEKYYEGYSTENQYRNRQQVANQENIQYKRDYKQNFQSNRNCVPFEQQNIQSQRARQNDKLDLNLNKHKIQDELMGENKNDFIDSFTEEEINVGKNEYYFNSGIANYQDDDLLSQKVFYIFVEGTKILHSIKFEEYQSFPKSAFQTDFLDINFKIPINHASIKIPHQDLVIVTVVSINNLLSDLLNLLILTFNKQIINKIGYKVDKLLLKLIHFYNYFKQNNKGGIMYEKNKNKSVRDVFKLNIDENTLEPLSGMLNARSQHGLVYDGGRVYAISGCSGQDESSSINKCEYYDLKSGKWVEMADCLYKASGAGLTLFNKKYIYKFGGKDDLVKPVSFIECYDIKNNSWRQVQFKLEINMNNSLSYYPFVKQINSNQILICGGYQHSIKMDTCYIINVNQSDSIKTQPELVFEKTRPLPGQFEFQYSESYINNGELFILKNAAKISSDDYNIFLVNSGNHWSFC